MWRVRKLSGTDGSLVSTYRSGTERLYPPKGHMVGDVERAALAGEPISGLCTVCGESVRFDLFDDNLRESGRCPCCGSSNRQRQLAWMFRREIGLRLGGPLVVPDGMVVYNTEANGALHTALKEQAAYECSEYWGEKSEYGTMVGGVRNEDLQALSFGDEVFDIVLSSDVFEHIPAPYIAHREVFRVLKHGGRHIFTVPYGEASLRDDVRASLVNGKTVHHAKALYHGDPVRPGEGVLVWTIFGQEMLVRLKEIGFNTELWRIEEPECGILGAGADVFIARKS